ncbi:MAG: hypothetical protein ACLQSR_10795 [Limisphaerales bacterium]
MFKFIFKWMFRLFLAAIALVVIAVVVFLLTYNAILKNYLEHNIREQTGMDVKIGRLHVGLLEPAIEIQNLRIYNPPGFGGNPFVNIPEIHIDYDRSALFNGHIHLTYFFLNLSELDIIKNENNELNLLPNNAEIQSAPAPAVSSRSNIEAAVPPAKFAAPTVSSTGNVPSAPNPVVTAPSDYLKEETGYDFTGIDRLKVSIGKAKYIDLKNPTNDCEQTIGISNCIVPHVRTMNDLDGLIVLIALRSDHFFDHVAGKNMSIGNPDALKATLRSMGLGF